MKIKPKHNLLLILSLIIFVIAITGYYYRHTILQWVRSQVNSGAPQVAAECPGCADYFPDVVAVMEKAYKSEKIQPQQTLADLDELYQQGVLVQLEGGNRYQIDEMVHSRPYVLPVVTSFLEDLASEYEKRLKESGLSYKPFIITSGTRSIESAKDLTEENNIARTRSHHLLGKTIDISYKRFGTSDKHLLSLVEALRSLRDEGRCYVKFEKSGALHLTVRK